MTGSSRITLADVRAAAERIAPHLLPTPALESAWLTELAAAKAKAPARVVVKWESLQRTGSFKLRGALNKLSILRARGIDRVLAVSAGNHGLGVAHAARLLGMHATIVVPVNASPTKVAAIRRYGVDLLPRGADYDEAEAEARRIAAERGVAFVSPYNDWDVIAGQATVTLEFLSQAAVETLLVPVGGGGLLAGAAIVARALAPSVRVIGVQPENAPAMHAAFAQKRIVHVAESPTLADGLAGNIEADAVTVPPIGELCDGIVLVSEASIARAIRGFVEHDHQIVEASGAVGAAALLDGKLDSLGSMGTVGLIASGRNIDLSRLRAILT